MLNGYRFALIYVLLAGGSFLVLESAYIANPLGFTKVVTVVFMIFSLLKSLLEIEHIEKIQAFLCSGLLLIIYTKLDLSFHSLFWSIPVIIVAAYFVVKNFYHFSSKRLVSLVVVTLVVVMIPDSIIFSLY